MEERDRYRYRIHSRQKTEREQEERKVRTGRRLLLLRWMTAGMLFLLLATAFYFDFSYHGFDREYVEAWLQNDELWEKAVTEVQRYLQVIGGRSD